MQTYALTDVGRKRQMNQDFVFCSQEPVGKLPNLFLVADGMGGHQAGDFASRKATELLLQRIEADTEEDPIAILENSIYGMNYELWKLAQTEPDLAGMGTTMVAAVLCEDTLYVANVGDSRLYVLGERIYQITRDHSLVEEMVAQGRMERGSAEYHARKNVITRAIGVSDTVEIDFFDVKLAAGQQILLCSDGLTNMVTDDEILTMVKRELPLRERAEALVEAANLSGGRDNITVILIER